MFCLCRLPLIFTSINIKLREKRVIFCCCFWKLCFIDRKTYFKSQFDFFFFLNITETYFSYLSSTDVDTIENHVLHFHVIVDRNQGFIFFHWSHFEFTNEGLVWRKIVGVQTWNLRMGKSWMLNVIIHYYTTHHSQKIVPFTEVLVGLNIVLAKAYRSPQTPSCILNSIPVIVWSLFVRYSSIWLQNSARL